MYAVCRGQGVTDAGQQQYQGPPPVMQLMDLAAKQWQVTSQDGVTAIPQSCLAGACCLHALA